MRTVLMQPGTTRVAYLTRARNYARHKFTELRATPEYRYCHASHAVAESMRLTEGRFVDLGTFGPEGDCAMNGSIDIQYLNTGDTYELTIVYYGGRWLVSSWGNIVERVTG